MGLFRKEKFPPANPKIGRRYQGKIDEMPVVLTVGITQPEKPPSQIIPTIASGVRAVVGTVQDIFTAARFTTAQAQFYTACFPPKMVEQIHDMAGQGTQVKVATIDVALGLQNVLEAKAHSISNPGYGRQIALVVPAQK